MQECPNCHGNYSGTPENCPHCGVRLGPGEAVPGGAAGDVGRAALPAGLLTRLICWLGVLAGILILIEGIRLAKTETSGYSGSYITSVTFGGDYYTEEHAATRKAGNNVYDLGWYLSGLAGRTLPRFGTVLAALGAVIACSFGLKLVNAAGGGGAHGASRTAGPAGRPAHAPARPAAAPAASENSQILAVIGELSALHEAGALSDEEFEQKEKELRSRLS